MDENWRRWAESELGEREQRRLEWGEKVRRALLLTEPFIDRWRTEYFGHCGDGAYLEDETLNCSLCGYQDSRCKCWGDQ
jgi:hypothetical protein